jgi:protein-tyrosine-phosphatase
MAVQLNGAQPPLFLKLLAHDLRWRLVMALVAGDHRAQELVALVGQPANLVSYHLSRLQRARLVRHHASSADRRAQYYSLDLSQLQAMFAQAGGALHPALTEQTGVPGTATSSHAPVRVLFLCTHNSARSQMAEALLRHLGGAAVEAFSAGTEPSEVRPEAIETMHRRGIAMAGQSSKHLNEYLGQSFDYVITVCDRARENCPLFPGNPEQIHWSFPDPAAVSGAPEARWQAFEQVARELTVRINFLLIRIRRDRQAAA